MPGICQIDVAPQSIEATFTGRQNSETFQYTKVIMIVSQSFFRETHAFSVSFQTVYTRFVLFQFSYETDIALICSQLQSSCNARRLLNHGKLRTRAPIFTPGKNSHSTFARRGTSLGA